MAKNKFGFLICLCLLACLSMHNAQEKRRSLDLIRRLSYNGPKSQDPSLLNGISLNQMHNKRHKHHNKHDKSDQINDSQASSVKEKSESIRKLSKSGAKSEDSKLLNAMSLNQQDLSHHSMNDISSSSFPHEFQATQMANHLPMQNFASAQDQQSVPQLLTLSQTNLVQKAMPVNQASFSGVAVPVNQHQNSAVLDAQQPTAFEKPFSSGISHDFQMFDQQQGLLPHQEASVEFSEMHQAPVQDSPFSVRSASYDHAVPVGSVNYAVPVSQSSNPVNYAIPVQSDQYNHAVPVPQPSNQVNYAVPVQSGSYNHAVPLQQSESFNHAVPVPQSDSYNHAVPVPQSSNSVNYAVPVSQPSNSVNYAVPVQSGSYNHAVPVPQSSGSVNYAVPVSQPSNSVNYAVPVSQSSNPVNYAIPVQSDQYNHAVPVPQSDSYEQNVPSQPYATYNAQQAEQVYSAPVEHTDSFGLISNEASNQASAVYNAAVQVQSENQGYSGVAVSADSYQQSAETQEQQQDHPVQNEITEQHKFAATEPFEPILDIEEDMKQSNLVNYPPNYNQQILGYQYDACLSSPCRFGKVCQASQFNANGFVCISEVSLKESIADARVIYEQILHVTRDMPREIALNTLGSALHYENSKTVNLKALKKLKINPCLINPCQSGYICVNSTEAKDGFICMESNDPAITTNDNSLSAMKSFDPLIVNLCRENNPEDRLAFANDTSKFVVCLHDGNYTIINCPENLVFNAYLDRCAYTTDSTDSNVGCDSSPCLFGGQCIDLPKNQYMCECADGFFGVNCEKIIDSCETKPCGPNGICHTMDEKSPLPYYCTCFHSKTFGLKCESEDDEKAELNPCHDNFEKSKYPTNLDPAVYVECVDENMKLNYCEDPLTFSPESESCVWVDNTLKKELTIGQKQ